VSKSARKRFVIKIEKQPAPVALKVRAGQRDAVHGWCAEMVASKNAGHAVTIWL
jgi:hypothetical protein